MAKFKLKIYNFNLSNNYSKLLVSNITFYIFILYIYVNPSIFIHHKSQSLIKISQPIITKFYIAT